jgi:hypothetical protein
MRKLSIAAFLLAALPLFLYPALVIAVMMSFAGHVSPHQFDGVKQKFLLLVALISQFTALAYPIVYATCFFYARAEHKKLNRPREIWFSLIPLSYLSFVGLLGFLWSFLETWTEH